MSEHLETERLAIRRFADSDLEPFLAYRNDPEVARYQSWDSCTGREATAMIEELKSEQPGTPGEWFQFAIELKETGALVGDCALKVEEDGRQAEVGFTLSREHQGKGYASEAVSRLLDYAFGQLTCTASTRSPTRRTRPPWRYSSGLACAGRAPSWRTRGSREGGLANTCTPSFATSGSRNHAIGE